MSPEKRIEKRVYELKQITVLMLLSLIFSPLALVAGSNLGSAADSGNETIIADFSASPLSGAAPLSVQFTDTSTGNPTTWNWDFGDGYISTKQNPVHTYSTAGTYSVTLTATNGIVSDKITKSNYITAGNGPTASFTASTSEGEVPLTVKFTDTSTGSPTKWSWDFGDGNTSTAQSPSHTYYGAGTYTVKLTATNSYGSSTASLSIHASSVTAPVADFSSNVTSGSSPLSVQFTDLSTNGPTAWEWDFNSDGTIDSTEQNPICVYTSQGTYSVTLNAINGTAAGSKTKSNFITVGNSLLASFTTSPAEGSVPLTVQFNDTSSGNATSWIWDFGDGNTSASQSPPHIYFSPGNYTVKLTVTNAFGSNTSAPSYVNVSSLIAPVPDFTSNVTSGQVPLTIQFNDTSAGGPTAWEWDFNSDGTIDSTEQNPVYQFTTNGSYTVTLRAGNGTAWGNITKSDYIMVGDGVHASFTVSTRSGGVPLTVQFNDTSTGNVTSWLWDFGDSNTSTEQNPSHEYSETGSYSITLNVSNAYGYSTVTWNDYIQVGEEEEDTGGSGGSGGSSSGGGGGSPEPASNVEVRELAQEFITTGDRIKFAFTKNATAVMYVKFESKRTFGKTTSIVEQLINRSVLTPKDPSGRVYKYLNIWVGNEGVASSENIANAIIGFRVKSSEISVNETNETDAPSVFMYRYSDGKWNALPTREIGEDGQYTYFESRTPGFSSFAIITGKKAIELKDNETEVPEPAELSPKNRQTDSSNAWPMQATEYKDWSEVSMAIKVIVGLMVVLLIGIAIMEKKNR